MIYLTSLSVPTFEYTDYGRTVDRRVPIGELVSRGGKHVFLTGIDIFSAGTSFSACVDVRVFAKLSKRRETKVV